MLIPPALHEDFHSVGILLAQAVTSEKAVGRRPQGPSLARLQWSKRPRHRSRCWRTTTGSFTNHFKSKEAFSAEVLENYFLLVRDNIEKTLRNDSLPPLRRLRLCFDLQIGFLKQTHFQSGCLIGNFSAEASKESVSIRRRLAEMSKEIQDSLVYCLKAAATAGELSASANFREVASFVYSSWQGAILQSKVERTSKPLENFKSVLSGLVLRPPAHRSSRKPWDAKKSG